MQYATKPVPSLMDRKSTCCKKIEKKTVRKWEACFENGNGIMDLIPLPWSLRVPVIWNALI